MTFTAESGNVAHAEVKGHRGNAYVMEILWENPASKEDIRQFDRWYVEANRSTTLISRCVEDARARAALIDSLLNGGTRN